MKWLSTRAQAWALCVGLAWGAPLQDPSPQEAPAAATAAVPLQLQPKSGALLRTWTADHTLALERMELQQGDDEPVVVQARGALTSATRIEARDELRRVANGRVELFTRRLDSAVCSGSLDLTGMDLVGGEVELLSPLVGTTVRFTWVPEEEQYGRLYEGEDRPVSLLRGLRHDADARVLLPAAAVSPGDSWTVAVADFGPLLAPYGDLSFAAEGRFDRNLARSLRVGVGGGLEQVLGGDAAGEVRVTLARIEEQAGTRIARLEVAFDLRYSNDTTEFSNRNLSRRERERGAEFQSSRTTLSYVGDGELEFDLGAGLVRRLELDGRQRVSMRIVEAAQSGPTQTQAIAFQGKLKVVSTAAPVASAASGDR